jgi:endonuclease G
MTIFTLLSAFLVFAQEPAVELPAFSPKDPVVRHTSYTLCYSEPHEQALWVAYILTAAEVHGRQKRTNDFRPDPFVVTGSAVPADYRGSGCDMGHLAPAADMKWSFTAMSESFYMSNMSPQAPGFNRGIWKDLESQVRTWAVINRELHVVTGPVLKPGLPTIGKSRVAVPALYYKVLLDDQRPEIKAIGFVMPNRPLSGPVTAYAVTVDSVERLTGLDFFPALPDSIEKAVEAVIHVERWPITRGGRGAWTNLPQRTYNPAAEVVFNTRSKKYHCPSCPSARQCKYCIETTLQDALDRDGVACKRCGGRCR